MLRVDNVSFGYGSTTRGRRDAESPENRSRPGRESLVLDAVSLQVERGYGAPYLPGFVALIGGAGLVTLAGVAISVTLSAAGFYNMSHEFRNDAAPRTKMFP